MSAELQVVYRPLLDLTPYERNARTHSAEQIAQIAASMQEFGWTNPILIDESGGIIAGHGRLAAAQSLGIEQVPTIELAGLSDEQRRALVLADNKLALNAGWDDALLRSELQALDTDGFDLDVIGFNADELAVLMADHGTPGLTDPDDAPPLPAEPVARPGDVWVLGRHRILCGDSTVATDVQRLLGGVVPSLMVTDPPYGVKYDANWRNEAERASGQKVGARAVCKVLNDDRADWREAWALFPGDVAYVWHAGSKAHIVADSLVESGFVLRAQIVWVKTRHVLSRGHYHPQHEPAYYAVREGADDQWRYVPDHEVVDYVVRKGRTGNWHGDRKQSTVWFIEHLKSDTGHSTQKPVDCMKRPIENNTSLGQAVYDPFSGSGTTIIACEMTGRACYAIELSPAYVDVAVKRWEQFTAKQAVLERADIPELESGPAGARAYA